MKKKSLAIIGATSLAGIAEAAGAIGAISNYFYDIALDRDLKREQTFIRDLQVIQKRNMKRYLKKYINWKRYI